VTHLRVSPLARATMRGETRQYKTTKKTGPRACTR